MMKKEGEEGEDDFEGIDRNELEVAEMVQEAIGGPEEQILLPESDSDSDHDSNIETDYDSSGH